MKHITLMNTNLELYLFKTLNTIYTTDIGAILRVFRRPKRKDIEYYL